MALHITRRQGEMIFVVVPPELLRPGAAPLVVEVAVGRIAEGKASVQITAPPEVKIHRDRIPNLSHEEKR